MQPISRPISSGWRRFGVRGSVLRAGGFGYGNARMTHHFCRSSRAHRLLAVGLLGLLASSTVLPSNAAESDSLPPRIREVLSRHGIPDRHVSIFVQSIDAAETALAHRADAARPPASTIKLLTTLSALEELGPAFRWRTAFYSDAPVRDARLDGNLYIQGHGDPALVIEQFWRMLYELRGTGLREITGDLVIDNSYFADEPGDPGEFDGQPLRAYNVLPQALLVNFQAVRLRFIPLVDSLRIVAEPMPADLSIDNRVRLRKGKRCSSWAAELGMRVQQREQGTRATFTGRYDAACGEREMYRAISEPAPFLLGTFRALWHELGGVFSGGIREGTVPESATLLYTGESPPLGEVVRGINKFSNNVMTRQLVMTLGAERRNPPGSTEKGIGVMRDWLARRGLNFPELVVENGTGLSRRTRISARHLGDLLRFGFRSPVMPEFIASLPIAATDGTVKKRFEGSLAGRMHLKTGRLDDVRALAGYVLDHADRRVAVVVLQNHGSANTHGGEQLEEAVLRWAYDGRPD